MTKQDHVVADLLNALDLIRREAQKANGSLHYIYGAAEQATKNALSECERNSDGYMVVKS